MIEPIELNLNETNIEEILKDKGIILLYSNWCPICKIVLFKLLETLENEKIKLYKVDVLKNKVEIDGVNSKITPQVIVFSKSNILLKFKGNLTDDDIDEIINAINPKNF